MRNIIFSTEKFKAIKRVLDANESVFEGEPALINVKQAFADKINELSDMISNLTVPVKSVNIDKIKARQTFVESLDELLQRSVILARAINDDALLITAKSYIRRYRSVSINESIQYAQYLLGIMAQKPEEAAASGLTQEIIDDIQAKIQQYRLSVENVSLSMGERKSSREQIKNLKAEITDLLTNDLDRFVRVNKKTHPDFSFAYNRVRWSRRRRVTNINIPLESDISGMVKDADTGLPIPGATLNLIEHAHAIEAGADGYYIFDELEAGEFTLPCHATGYEVPESVIINLNDNDSYIHNFNLVPIPAEA